MWLATESFASVASAVRARLPAVSFARVLVRDASAFSGSLFNTVPSIFACDVFASQGCAGRVIFGDSWVLGFRRFRRGCFLSNSAERITVGFIVSDLIRFVLGDALCSGVLGVPVMVAGRFCWVADAGGTTGLRSV